MVYFLLVISFIINGIIIFALFTLFTRVKRTEEIELRRNEVAREIEDLFSSYLLEIKEENKRLETNLSRQDKNGFTRENREQKRESYLPPHPSQENRRYEPSPHSRVIKLHKEGETVDDIAKQLNLGITETELIIKFHQKK
ncbi:swarming motility protein SwrB [Halobacillus andaensis]|uniref:Swarming motility protein SwrB n=1 Tax=Halobacillus andaensis TaxID=1176239 RepID=A0A917ESU3_HALAA|nr:coupling factor for flagellin transcription and translation [Halobacillus andaensis]MBP2003469.1 hypothetical protein [Halobacillus andaensis]GGF10842.1 swarming motility protein SwrB [Halobacillus andaensis]